MGKDLEHSNGLADKFAALARSTANTDVPSNTEVLLERISSQLAELIELQKENRPVYTIGLGTIRDIVNAKAGTFQPAFQAEVCESLKNIAVLRERTPEDEKKMIDPANSNDYKKKSSILIPGQA